MKLSYRNRNIILLCIGFLFVGSGIFQIIFKIKVNEKISGNIQNGLLVVAGLIFFMGRKNKNEEVKENEEVKVGGHVMLYPFKFKPVYKDYIWGGRGLEKLGKKLPAGIVAESWEISSHPDGESKVLSGEYKDMSISELTKAFGRGILGSELPKEDLEKFPLLIKLIDANDKLSVQVHPKDEYAKIHENGELGKNEMWYIVFAKPGAKIVYGVSKGVTKETFEAAVKAGKIETCLNYLEVFEGDTVNIPAGMLHAIGEGIIIAEIQQNSNTTYRVFDYNRTDAKGIKRPLHIEKALEVIDFNNCNISGKQKGLKVNLEENCSKSFLLANEYFSVEKYSIAGEVLEEADGDRFYTYTCLQGEGEIVYSGGTQKLQMGESILIPASLGNYTIEGQLELIKAYVPNIEENVIKPLLKAGFSSEEIYSKVIGVQVDILPTLAYTLGIEEKK